MLQDIIMIKTVILAGGLGTRISEETKKFLNQW